jgi:hypothetical protein
LETIHINGKLDLRQDEEEVLEYLEKVSLTKIVKVGEHQYMVNKK